MSPEPREPLGPDGFTEPIRSVPYWPPADLMVHVLDRNPGGEKELTCCVTTPHLEEYCGSKTGEWLLPDAADAVVTSQMEEFTMPGQEPGARIKSLQGAGMEMFQSAPEVFKDAYWKMIDADAPLQTILVASEERSFPWELMVPVRDDESLTEEDLMPLGVRFNMGRWYENGMDKPNPAAFSDARVVAPRAEGKKPLSNAENEKKLVLGSFGGESVQPCFVKEIDQQLKPWRGSLLHFVCHGETPTPMVQRLLLDKTEKLTLNRLRAMLGLKGAVHAARPVVFLNACEAGRETISLVGAGGFAKQFVDAGACAVIAPLWSVGDNEAFEVATDFYSAVRAEPETPFGEILRRIRTKAYEGDSKDTYAAYCLYGDPLLAAAG